MAGFEANFSSPVTSASAAFPYLAALSDDDDDSDDENSDDEDSDDEDSDDAPQKLSTFLRCQREWGDSIGSLARLGSDLSQAIIAAGRRGQGQRRGSNESVWIAKMTLLCEAAHERRKGRNRT